MAISRREAYVTMVTSKDYIIGALVLAHSLEGTGTSRPLLCMVTKNLDNADLESLKVGGLQPVLVEPIAAPSLSNVQEWDAVGYTKLNLWGLVDWDFLVYVDADCLVVSNMDDLFGRYVFLPWCRAFGPCSHQAPGKLHSQLLRIRSRLTDSMQVEKSNMLAFGSFTLSFLGVMVIKPSRQVLEDMLSKTNSIASYDGGDTGFLNAYFPDWFRDGPDSRLPFGYNALRTMHWMTK